MARLLLVVLLFLTVSLTFAFWCNAQDLAMIGAIDRIQSLTVAGSITAFCAVMSALGLVCSSDQ